jgi:hypothetical protein
MSPLARRKVPEKRLPVQRSGGRLWPDEETLRKLGGSFDQMFVLLELGTSLGDRPQTQGQRLPHFSRIEFDVFSQRQPAFPSLLSPEHLLFISRNDLITELELIIEMKNQGPAAPMVYSVQVISPKDYQTAGLSIDLPYAQEFELTHGYLYHGVLETLSREKRIELLEKFLADAVDVEVMLRISGQDSLRKIVKLNGEEARIRIA